MSNILQRCRNPNNHAYAGYGGRGIRCYFTTAEEIIGDIGRRPNNMYSIDRIDNNGHYERGNVRWATKKQQAANRRPKQ